MAQPYRSQPPALRARWPLLLYLLPVPLLVPVVRALLAGDLARLLAVAGALGLFALGAAAVRQGLVAEAHYRRRRIATAPRTPRKMLGATLVAGGVFVCRWLVVDNSPAFALAVALAALAGCLLLYGTDPRGSRGAAAASHGYTTEEIVAALEEAEAKIAGIETAGAALGCRELEARLARITALARQVLEVIEEDPGDLRRARRFLNVYLDGARRVVEGYARTHRHGQEDAALAGNFRNVLDTIEAVFAEQHRKLLEDDAFDLDVQIEVLATQLKREGVV